MKAILFILSFLLFSRTNAQNEISSKLRLDSIELVKSIMRKDKEFTSYGTGPHGKISKQYQRFIFLLNRLSINELLELSNDSSGCIRLYAFTGLVHKNYRGTKEIRANLLGDSTKIPVMIGCGGGNVYMYAMLKSFNQWYDRKFVTRLLKEQDKQKEFWYKNYVFANR